MKKQFIFISICLAFILTLTASNVFAGEASKSAENQYKIGNSDILNITTWKEIDFTRTDILVRIDGKISFPLLDDVQADGRTPLELKKDIQNKLKAFLDNPVVTVTVTRPASKKIYILGEVVRTGEYPLVKNLTVLQAFALAGGFTQWASKKEIILFRKEDGQDKTIRINYKNILNGKDFSQNVQLQLTQTFVRAPRSDKYSHPPKADKADQFFVAKLLTSRLSAIVSSLKCNIYCPKGMQFFPGRVRPGKRICLCPSVCVCG